MGGLRRGWNGGSRMVHMTEHGSALAEEPPVDPGPLFAEIDFGIQGMARVAALTTAVRYSLFDHLARPMSPDELARLIGADVRLIAPICSILADMKLLNASSGTYESTPLSTYFLSHGSPFRQDAYVEKIWRHLKELWICLPEILAKGPVSYPAGKFFGEMSLPAMAQNALCGRLQRVVREIITLPHFPSFRKMIDLGGGHGLYAIALTLRSPSLHAWVFDLPYIIPLTEQCIARYEAARVGTLAGNFFTDDFGEGYDLVFSSSNPSGKRIEMLPRIADALLPGGFFVNVQSTGKESFDSYQSLEWQLWSIEGEDGGEDRTVREQPFPTPEYIQALTDAGFSLLIEKDIKDDYHRNARVRMIIAEKKR